MKRALSVRDRSGRIALVEPNATSHLGHPASGIQAVADYLRAKGVTPVAAVNRSADDEVLASLPGVVRVVTRSTFDRRVDEVPQFEADLRWLHRAYGLTSEDHVIVMTGHLRELRGAAAFVSRARTPPPRLHLVLHQLYPPCEDFQDTLDPAFRTRVEAALSTALHALAGTSIRVWTTPSEPLRHAVEWAAGFPVGTVPVPLSSTSAVACTRDRDRPMHLAFLGDNRCEKGLILLMRAILLGERRIRYTLQLTSPRGYGTASRSMLKRLVNRVCGLPNVRIVEGTLLGPVFDSLLASCDAVALPYHPASYDRRVSGLLLCALRAGVTPLVSDRTWLAAYCHQLDVGGIFEYGHGDQDASRALAAAISDLARDLPAQRARSRRAASHVAAQHNPETFLRTLLLKPA